MKKLLIIILTLFFLLSLTSCKSASEVAGEKLVEKMVEKGLDGDVDVDGDKVIIKGKDGQKVSLGGSEWPTEQSGREVPELKDGIITYVQEAKDACLISMEQVMEGSFEDYLTQVRDAGYNKDEMVSRDDETVFYTASNSKNTQVHLAYDKNSGDLMITVTMNVKN